MVDHDPTTYGMVIFIVPVLELCMHECACSHSSADGDDAKAEMVRKAMLEAKLSDELIKEFNRSDLFAMYKGGYKTAIRIQNAKRNGLEKCLDLAGLPWSTSLPTGKEVSSFVRSGL